MVHMLTDELSASNSLNCRATRRFRGIAAIRNSATKDRGSLWLLDERILSPMPFRESRRSTRVPLRVAIAVEGGTGSLTCEGETVVVNLHGALLSTTIGLSVGTKISIHVYLTDKRSKARVVYADPENPLRCGIELDQPRNIWGVPLPPGDWDETAELHFH
jgi:hypothetical protein